MFSKGFFIVLVVFWGYWVVLKGVLNVIGVLKGVLVVLVVVWEVWGHRDLADVIRVFKGVLVVWGH